MPEAEQTIPTLLITGGSQGAQSINEAAYAAYSGLLDAGYRIIHLCGKKNYFSMKQKAPQDKRLILLPYLEQMEYGLAVADPVSYTHLAADYCQRKPTCFSCYVCRLL